MSEQVPFVVNQGYLVEKVTEDYLLTHMEDIYKVVEGNARDELFVSEGVASINSVSFANRPQVCCVDYIQDDKQVAILPQQKVNEGSGHTICSIDSNEIGIIGLILIPKEHLFFWILFYSFSKVYLYM